MAIHVLKTWPEYFKELWTGYKTFEIRKNDRNYMEGDVLVLREFNPINDAVSGQVIGYSGRVVVAEVGYIIQGQFGLASDYCVMSIMPSMVKFSLEEIILRFVGDESEVQKFLFEKIRGDK